MHVHTAPDVPPRLMNDLELTREVEQAGYRGVVLKSHHTPTAARAAMAEAAVGGGVRVLGGVALNTPSTGGINASAVEAAAAMGGRVVWMPTFTARNHLRFMATGHGEGLAFLGRVERAVDVVDEHGELLPEVLAVLDVVAEHDLTLATGHLGPADIMLLVPEARRRGVRRVVVTHPEMDVVSLSLDRQVELAELGGVWFERVAVITRSPMDHPVSDIAEAIRVVGVESTVLATDLGQPGNPSPVRGLEEYVAALRRCGFGTDEIEAMVCAAPAAALALGTEEGS
ncbi:DUF6282 family protein [Blastococcus sp. SYSU DS0616]